MTTHIDWLGKSGAKYRYFHLASLAADQIKAVAGNYVFTKRIANGNYVPLYFGESGDLKVRLPRIRYRKVQVMAKASSTSERAVVGKIHGSSSHHV